MELVRHTGRGVTLAAAGALACMLAAPGCANGLREPPATLADGTPARPPPVRLEGIEDSSIATVVRVRPAEHISPGSAGASCIEALRATPSSHVVERTGVSGVTVTFIGPGGRTVRGCDAAGVESDDRWSWCGRVLGRIDGGELRDPRLDLGCRDRGGGHPLGFVWVEPGPATRFVAVRRKGYAEVFSVASGLPVRVTTSDVDVADSAATFSISEHRADGRALLTFTLDAQVAG